MKKFNFSLIAIICFMALSIISCKKKEDVPPGTDVGNDGTPKYIVSLRTQGSGEGTADYVLLKNNLMEGEISAEGQGIEQLGWRYFATAGNTFFSFSYSQPNNDCIAYKLENGEVVEKGKLMFKFMDCFGKGEGNTLVGIGAPWGGGSLECEIQLVDADDIAIIARKPTPIYMMSPSDTLNKWPTSTIVRDGKLFVGFYPLSGKTWETPLTDTAYVAVFSYPGLEYLTTIKDTRTGPVGFYGNPECMIKTDNGDIYTFSPNSLGAGYTKATKKSGILRIKNGATQFDPNYFFDVETATDGHYKLLSGTYVGDNKMVGRVIVDEKNTDDWQWAALNVEKSVCKLVIIDLESKTITDVSGVPMHGGQFAARTLVENGKLYMSIASASAGEVAIYEIDPATATGKKGAVVKGLEVPAIFKVQ